MAKPKLTDFSPSLDLGDRRIAIDAGTRRIAVRVAKFGETHSGFGPMVRVPRNVNVEAAHVGHAELDDGTSLRVATLPHHTTHAPKDMKAMHAASWYEDTGTAIARVRYSIDEEGIRADGLLYDSITDSDIDQVQASSASGDWRTALAIKRFEDFENTPCDFVGSCVVNVPGYSDTFAQKPGQNFALAASAHSIISIEDESMPDENDTVDTPCGEPCTTCTCGAKDSEATITLSAASVAELVKASKVERLAIVNTGLMVDATKDQVERGVVGAFDPKLDGITPDQLEVALAEASAALTAAGYALTPDPNMSNDMTDLWQRLVDLEQVVYEAIASI